MRKQILYFTELLHFQHILGTRSQWLLCQHRQRTCLSSQKILLDSVVLDWEFFFFFFFCLLSFFFFFSVVPAAYGGFQARGLIGPVAAGLHQSHSNEGSELHLRAHGNAGSLTHQARTGIKPATSWFLVGLVSAVPRWEFLEWEYFIYYLSKYLLNAH